MTDSAAGLIPITDLELNTQWFGWIACLWWHQVPQLFAIQEERTSIPENCDYVDLIEECVSGC